MSLYASSRRATHMSRREARVESMLWLQISLRAANIPSAVEIFNRTVFLVGAALVNARFFFFSIESHLREISANE